MVYACVWRWLLVVVCLGLQSIAATAQVDEWQDASTVVLETTDSMLSVLAESAQQTVPEITPGIDRVLALAVDFRTIAKSVMAKYYRHAEPEQFENFVGVFRHSLVQAYTKALLTLNIDAYDLQKRTGEDDRVGREKVWVKVYASSNVYDIHYTLSAKSGSWKITNVVIDGVNLGLAFRNQFAMVMRQHGNNMDAVIANWNAKVY